jgi:uncharacterized damage-inducible protein DinB
MTATAMEPRATRPSAEEFAPYYGTYVNKVADGDIVATLKGQFSTTLSYLRGIPESRGGHRYAEGKWSIRQVIGHMSDAERIFAYRALRFARADATALPGFDENEFVKQSRLDDRTLASLIAEFEAVRAASVALFDGLFPDEWTRHGLASGKDFSVRSLAWIIAGHEVHHLEVLKQRYV